MTTLTEQQKKLKEESREDAATIIEAAAKPKAVAPVKPKPVVEAKKTVTTKAPSAKSTVDVSYYIQVGSFSKYEPNKKFLQSITDLGYNYKYHKVTKDSKTLNKVLVGPFSTTTEAKDARRVLRAKVEPGAFLTKL